MARNSEDFAEPLIQLLAQETCGKRAGSPSWWRTWRAHQWRPAERESGHVSSVTDSWLMLVVSWLMVDGCWLMVSDALTIFRTFSYLGIMGIELPWGMLTVVNQLQLVGALIMFHQHFWDFPSYLRCLKWWMSDACPRMSHHIKSKKERSLGINKLD